MLRVNAHLGAVVLRYWHRPGAPYRLVNLDIEDIVHTFRVMCVPCSGEAGCGSSETVIVSETFGVCQHTGHP